MHARLSFSAIGTTGIDSDRAAVKLTKVFGCTFKNMASLFFWIVALCGHSEPRAIVVDLQDLVDMALIN